MSDTIQISLRFAPESVAAADALQKRGGYGKKRAAVLQRLVELGIEVAREKQHLPPKMADEPAIKSG